jgi:uncharacterized MAPEG superfamily protein
LITDIGQTYQFTLYAMTAMTLLMFVQVIIADVVGIRSQHTPGASVPADHSDLFFRVTRTVANTNETIAIFILAVAVCLFSGASPTYTAYAAWTFVIARAAYAVLYYGNLKVMRSVVFAISILALACLLIIGLIS